jgi:hypothetical protein
MGKTRLSVDILEGEHPLCGPVTLAHASGVPVELVLPDGSILQSSYSPVKCGREVIGCLRTTRRSWDISKPC